MKLEKELVNLAKEFKNHNYTLYIVGGFVRDYLLNLKSSDIDIASNMPYDLVMKICKKQKLKTIEINKMLGTLQIHTKNQIYEYTQFRKESYIENGSHCPNNVIFVDDIETDSKRRDITINSIYYDIYNKKIIDPLNGQKDLKSKIIRTSNIPNITLKDDGIRILRIIRFANKLNFKIDKKTLKSMKQNVSNLKNISKERIIQELNLISENNLTSYKNDKFLNTLNKLQILDKIFSHTFIKTRKFSKKDIMNFYKINQNGKLIGFYFLVLKNFAHGYLNTKLLFYTVNILIGQFGLKESKNNTKILTKLYMIFQNLYYNKDDLVATLNYLSSSDTERNIIEVFLDKNAINTLNKNKELIKSKNLPLSIYELKINALDLKKANIDDIFIGKILSVLYNQVIDMKVENEKNSLLELAINIDKHFKTLKE